MSSYSDFAEFYDTLTGNVDYEQKAGYLLQLLQRHRHEPGVTLDLACGTGSLTLALCQRGIDVFGLDASADMLSVAQQKAAEKDRSILFLCQKMQHLNLYGMIDTCVCSLDSINHLTKTEDVLRTFRGVARYLQKDGLFVFDCNTVFKHQQILGDNCYIYDTKEVFCAWQNNYSPRHHKVIITLDFFRPDGKIYHRYSEQFTERAYTHEEMSEMLQEAGLTIEAIYDDMTFEAPKPDSQREIYVVRKNQDETR